MSIETLLSENTAALRENTAALLQMAALIGRNISMDDDTVVPSGSAQVAATQGGESDAGASEGKSGRGRGRPTKAESEARKQAEAGATAKTEPKAEESKIDAEKLRDDIREKLVKIGEAKTPAYGKVFVTKYAPKLSEVPVDKLQTLLNEVKAEHVKIEAEA